MTDEVAPRKGAYELVVMGTSWGGLHALGTLLGGLPSGFSTPLVVAQHRGPDSSNVLTKLLQERTHVNVVEASDKDPIEPGHLYIAPPDYHLLVEPGWLALSIEGAVRFSRPSVDVMFESAADAYADRLVGVILTGANDDGSKGLKHIRAAGGVALVQDPATAERPEMPEAAIAAVDGARVLPLEEMASFLVRLCG